MAHVSLAITSMFKVVYALSLVLNFIEIIYILSSSKNRKSFIRNPQLLMLNLAFADFTFGLGGTGNIFSIFSFQGDSTYTPSVIICSHLLPLLC